MKKILIIAGAILLTALVAAGGFWGGMAYQSNRAEQARASFINARGGQLPGDGQLPGGGQLPEGWPAGSGGQGPGFLGGRGTTGQVKSIEGDVLTLSTAQDVITVHLNGSTQIVKSVTGTVEDLQPGTRVVVAGEEQDGGAITADQVQILTSSPPSMEDPAAPGTEP